MTDTISEPQTDAHDDDYSPNCPNCAQTLQDLLAAEERLRMIRFLTDAKELRKDQREMRRKRNFGERANGTLTSDEQRYSWMHAVIRGIGGMIDESRKRGIV